jgi:hypothetical protein
MDANLLKSFVILFIFSFTIGCTTLGHPLQRDEKYPVIWKDIKPLGIDENYRIVLNFSID